MSIETRGVWAVEVRARGRELTGRFPYGSTATVSDRGRVRKESFGPNAFRFAVEDAEREIHLLVGHSFDKPLASRGARSLELEDTAEALTFRAQLPEAQPTYMRDTLLQLDAGLIGGVSPGFRVPPKSAVPNAEELLPEPGNPGVAIRRINEAVLIEISLVSRPAYDETAVELNAAHLAGRERQRRRRWPTWL